MKTGPSHPPDDWTILALVQWTTAYFESHRIDSPRSTAEILLAHALEISRIELYLRYDQPLNRTELARYKELIRRRIRREPVAYIVGEKEFWSLPLTVNRHVLIPRPETECLVEQALADIPEQSAGRLYRVLELGAGSGAIVCALSSQRPGHLFFALDISVEAITIARRNVIRHGLEPSVGFICGDLFSALEPHTARFDLIVSNPPYIASAEIDRLQPEIVHYEPRGALDGGPNGLVVLDRIIRAAPDYLQPGGVLILEIGHDQFEAVRAIAADGNGYDDISVKKDFSGFHRVVRMVRATGKFFKKNIAPDTMSC
jgi:release factor glutamine methyltransferase